MTRFLILLALLLPSSAYANDCQWSKDGRYFVVSNNEMSEFGEPVTVTVYDARTGTVDTTFTLAPDVGADESSGPKGDDAALDKWKAAHGLVEAKAAEESPDGKGKVVVEKVFKGGKGAWSGDTWRSTLEAHAVMTVVRDGRKVVSARWGSVYWGLDAHFDPTGRRVAWEVSSSRPMFRSPSTYEYRFGPASPPRIQLMAVKAILPEVVKVVGLKLEQAGYVAALSLPAKSERSDSEVFAAKGFEDVAQKVAAAIPGGAKVSALSWKADADVVVAAGTKALGR
jgi:hypothetical protein